MQTFRAFFSAYFGVPAHLPTRSLKPFCSVPVTGLPQILKNYGDHPAVIQGGDLSFDHLYPFSLQNEFETIVGAENFPKKKNTYFYFPLHNYESSPLENTSRLELPNKFGATSSLPRLSQNLCLHRSLLGHFLKWDGEKKLLDKSILFIVGDHGQEMCERRPFSPIRQNLYEENIHLPLLILAGGKIKAPAPFDTPASFIDFLPTVLDALKIQDPHHSLGTSLLRKISTPTFFSTQEEIGCIKERKKIILFRDQTLGFDLAKDPEETTDISPSLNTLVSPCKAYFKDIDAMYKKSAWAPKKISPHEAPLVTDKLISKTNPKHALLWHEIISPGSCHITDNTLSWISERCPNLMTLDLSHCHLLTDKGIFKVLSKLKNLRHLRLNGVGDLKDFAPENTPFNLKTLFLKDVPDLTARSLKALFMNSPDLLDWSVSVKQVKGNVLAEMSLREKKCTSMSVSDGIDIDDGSISSLFLVQKDLQEVHIENFPLLKSPNFSILKKLEYLTLSDCPLLSDTIFESIQDLPLLRLEIQGCAQITKRRITQLRDNVRFKIFFSY